MNKKAIKLINVRYDLKYQDFPESSLVFQQDVKDDEIKELKKIMEKEETNFKKA